MRISTKTDMYAELKSGRLGNAFRTWPSVDAAIADGYWRKFGLRTGVKNGPSYPGNMTEGEARVIEHDLRNSDITSLIFCEEVHNDLVTINAEVCLAPGGLELKYRCGPGHMRSAMANPLYAKGMKAAAILAHHLDYGDIEWLTELLNKYEGAQPDTSAIVEFANFSEPCGIFDKRMIVWEVRAY